MPGLISKMYKICGSVVNATFLSNPATKQKPKVLIFFDQGVSLHSVVGLVINLGRILSQGYRINLIHGDAIKNTSWEKNTKLLVMPGGRARPYYSALGAKWRVDTVEPGEFRELSEIGEGNKKIRAFVENGGGYLGICAGAYYAAQQTVFDKKGKHEVLDEGALKFFKGDAIGPVYGLGEFSYRTRRNSRLAKVSDQSKTIGEVYYHGGCFFKSVDRASEEVASLANYEDLDVNHSAIVSCKVGKGLAILSGVHFEIMGPYLLPRHLFFSQPQRLRQENKNFQNRLMRNLVFSFFHKGEKRKSAFEEQVDNSNTLRG